MDTVKPSLSVPFPTNREWWTCPKTGLKVPMREAENVAYRERLLHKAAKDPVLQRDLRAACAASRLFFVNAFCWTLWEIEVNVATHGYTPAKVALHPFITFEKQDEWFDWVGERFERGEDALTHKSRDMGASWLHAIFFHHLWLFRPNTQLREMSRTEDMVDSPISKSLFFKHDTINAYLPEWLCPPGVLVRGRENRTSLRIHNALNSSTIAGESTNRSALSGDRCAVLLLDEFAKVENGASIKQSTAAVTACRLVNSTVDLPGSAYSQWKNSGTIKVFSMMAWDHPRKGAGRFIVQDDVTKEYRITSPFIEHEIERNGWREVAVEIYGIEGMVGETFFQHADLDKHAAMYCREPRERFNIRLRDKIANADVGPLFRSRDLKAVSLSRAREGELAVWVPLTGGRLDQSKSYIIGVDISKGQGGEGTSETVASVKCKQTGEIVAKWASRCTPPYEAARTVAALTLWVGGAAPQRLPLVIWEINGPGWDFTNVFVRQMGYPYYYRNETIGTVGVKKTDKIGWHSNPERKRLLLSAYERALKENRIINRDKQSLDQAKTYITYPNGGCGPAELVDKDKATYLGHGDRVIADALTVLDKSVMSPRKGERPDAPAGTFGARRQTQERAEKVSKRDWRRHWAFR